MTDRTRRWMLGTIGVSAAGGLAGCFQTEQTIEEGFSGTMTVSAGDTLSRTLTFPRAETLSYSFATTENIAIDVFVRGGPDSGPVDSASVLGQASGSVTTGLSQGTYTMVIDNTDDGRATAINGGVEVSFDVTYTYPAPES